MNPTLMNTEPTPKTTESPDHATRRRWRIDLVGCDDATSFDMDLTDSEADTLHKVSEASKKASDYSCQPVMEIQQKESASSREGLLVEIFRKEAESQNNA